MKMMVSLHEHQVEYLKKHHVNLSDYLRTLIAENDPEFPVYRIRQGLPPERLPRCAVCGSLEHVEVYMNATPTEDACIECPDTGEVEF